VRRHLAPHARHPRQERPARLLSRRLPRLREPGRRPPPPPPALPPGLGIARRRRARGPARPGRARPPVAARGGARGGRRRRASLTSHYRRSPGRKTDDRQRITNGAALARVTAPLPFRAPRPAPRRPVR